MKRITLTPQYRVLGDIWVRGCSSAKEFDPNIPLIQMYNFAYITHGREGGPLFNAEGYIVGMMMGQYCDYDIAIHVSLLKAFWEEKKPRTSAISQDGGSKKRLSRKEKGKVYYMHIKDNEV